MERTEEHVKIDDVDFEDVRVAVSEESKANRLVLAFWRILEKNRHRRVIGVLALLVSLAACCSVHSARGQVSIVAMTDLFAIYLILIGPGNDDKSEGSVRMTLELPPKARCKLEELSTETDQSFSEVIRRALAAYNLLWAESKKGNSVIIRSPETDREIIFSEFRD